MVIATQSLLNDAALRQFVYLCLRGRWDPTALLTARNLLGHTSLDWDQLLRGARAESLTPLLYTILKDQGLLPSTVEQTFRHAYLRNRGRNIFLYDEVKTLLGRLEAEGVPVILLKGIALARVIYQEFAIRPSTDVDLLVHRKDIPVALRQIEALGFTPVKIELHEGATIDYENEIQFCKPEPVRIIVELHWSLFDSPYYQHTLPMDWFWQTSLPVDFYGVPARILGPEAQVLHLCGHILLHHQGNEMLWLHDIAEVVLYYQESLDWIEMLAFAQQYDMVLPLQKVLKVVHDEWRAPIPENILQELLTLQASPLEDRIFASLTAENRTVGHRFLDDLAGMPGWRERLRFAKDNLFPSIEYMRSRYGIYHPVLLPFYYPYRWYRGLRSLL